MNDAKIFIYFFTLLNLNVLSLTAGCPNNPVIQEQLDYTCKQIEILKNNASHQSPEFILLHSNLAFDPMVSLNELN